jgi:small subunit ribosomal protein S8
MYTDPISDMLTRIRNASLVRKAEVVLPYSKFKHRLAELLVREGFLSAVKEVLGQIKGQKELSLTLKYSGTDAVIGGIKRVSKPGQRIYLASDKLPRTNSGYGLTVVSTSKGLLSDKEARKQHLGGEVICQVW